MRSPATPIALDLADHLRNPPAVPERPRTSEGITLTQEVAGKLARLILPSLTREYPNRVVLDLEGDRDLRPPRDRTPAFFGCFDWHSAVHSHLSVARLVRQYPDAAWAREAREALSRSLSPERMRAEAEHLRRHPSFEMPYGVAWVLALAAELEAGGAAASTWRDAVRPLEDRASSSFEAWLRRLSHPIRTGEHNQTAFAIALALGWAESTGRADSAERLRRTARRLYADDRGAPLAFEPSAHDFLSPALAEASLMARVLPTDEVAPWLDAFLPQLADPDLGKWFAPVRPVDRSDGKLVHFDGLNLSRAWMLRRIAAAVPEGDPRRLRLTTLAAVHGRAGLGGVAEDHYAGAHWLGTFAVMWLTSRAES